MKLNILKYTSGCRETVADQSALKCREILAKNQSHSKRTNNMMRRFHPTVAVSEV